MATYALKVNGTDLATVGLTITRIAGPWDVPQRTFDEIVVPNRAGATRSTTKATVAARDLTVTGTVSATSPEDLADTLDTIDALCATDDVTLIVGVTTTREYSGAAFMTSLTGMPSDPQFVNKTAQVEIKFRLLDPYSQTITATTVTAAASTPVTTPLGVKPSLPAFTITSPTTPFTITSSKGGTITLGTGTGTSWVIDCDAMTVTVDGTRHDEYVTAGDFFELACGAGEYASSTFPTVQTSSGSLSCTYHKKWR